MKTITRTLLAVTAAAFLAAGCGEGDQDDRDAAVAAAPEILQKTCPVMEGGKVNPKIYADHEGRRIYFCCQGCIGEFKKDPAKYIAKVDKEIAGN